MNLNSWAKKIVAACLTEECSILENSRKILCMQGCMCINCLSGSTTSMAIASARLLVLWRIELPIEGKAPAQVKKSSITPFPIILPLPIQNFFVWKMVGSLAGASEFFMILLLSISTIISPTSDITAANSRNTRKEGTERTGRIKWQGWSGGEENERQMANNINVREMGLWWVLGMSWLGRRPRRQRRQKSHVGGRSNLDLTWWNPPRQWHQKSFLLCLELALVFLEEERVMQQ